jgi:hypothetical protein
MFPTSFQEMRATPWPGNSYSLLGFALPLGMFAIVNWGFSLQVTPTTVSVRNMFVTRKRELVEIVKVYGTYNGLVIKSANRRRMTAWAVPKYNISVWLKRESRSDRVAAEILRRAKIARGELAPKG